MDSWGTIVLPFYGSPVRPYRPRGWEKFPGASATKRARLETRTVVTEEQRRKMASLGSHHTSYSKYDASFVRCPRSLLRTLSRQPDEVDTGTSNGILSSGIGRQHWTDLYLPFNNSVMSDINNKTQLQWSALSGVPNWSTGGGSVSIPSARLSAKYIYIKSFQAEFVFKNSTNTQVRMFIYDLCAKQDAGVIENNEGTAAMQVLPHDMIDSGVELALNTADEIESFANLVHILPHQAHATLSPFWRTCKLTKVVLDPGEMHIHKFYFAPHWMFPTYKIRQQNAANGNVFLGGSYALRFGPASGYSCSGFRRYGHYDL